MLSGLQIINYFGSAPLNRVAFLRGEHVFLSQAVQHPTTRFMLFKDLSPLCKSPTEVSYASYSDVRSLIGGDPYSKSEKEMIEEYNSSKATPQLIFLGLEESKKDGLTYKHFTGAPHFAVDITPRSGYEDEANELLSTMEKRGAKPLEGLRAMRFPADIGELASFF